MTTANKRPRPASAAAALLAVWSALFLSRRRGATAFAPSPPVVVDPRTLVPAPSRVGVGRRRRRRDSSDSDRAVAPSSLRSSSSLESSSSSSSSGENDAPGGGSERRYTHLIAVPLESSHDLLLELESVQRGILYHAPCLVHACVVPSCTRLPLLCVNAVEDPLDDGGSGSFGTPDLFGRAGTALDARANAAATTEELHDIVSEVVREKVFVRDRRNRDRHASSDRDESELASGLDFERRDGPNEDGIEPVMIRFKGLEVDGETNDVLHAVWAGGGTKEGEGTNPTSKDDDDADLLRDVVREIKRRVEDRGWRADLPDDSTHGRRATWTTTGAAAADGDGEKGDERDDDEAELWRPRVPFMRIPPNFDELLPPLEDEDDGSDSVVVRPPELGGNGISPILFYKWWDDALPSSGDAVRMRDVAVYSRTGGRTGGGGGVSESAFYLPAARVALPGGNEILRREEERHGAYDDRRFAEEERRAEAEGRSKDDFLGGTRKTNGGNGGDDNGGVGVERDRRSIEKSYDASPDRSPSRPFAASDDDVGSSSPPPTAPSTPSPTANDRDPIVRKIVSSRAYVRSRDPSLSGKDKPSIADNPIFNDYKNNKLKNKLADDRMAKRERELPPFPSEEYFVGIWRVVSSPLSSSSSSSGLDDPTKMDVSTAEENLILRVDGTTAGGPMLDSESRHRAAGGSTWRIFQAVRKNDVPGGGERDERTRLRIRLVIPPDKTKVVVLEGEATRILAPDDDRMAPRSFGIPEVEAAWNEASRAGDADVGGGGGGGGAGGGGRERGLLYVGGEAWVEDVDRVPGATAAASRKKVGTFSLMKLRTLDPSMYRYTIPGPVRNQD